MICALDCWPMNIEMPPLAEIEMNFVQGRGIPDVQLPEIRPSERSKVIHQ
jgi:hypothetical protein